MSGLMWMFLVLGVTGSQGACPGGAQVLSPELNDTMVIGDVLVNVPGFVSFNKGPDDGGCDILDIDHENIKLKANLSTYCKMRLLCSFTFGDGGSSKPETCSLNSKVIRTRNYTSSFQSDNYTGNVTEDTHESSKVGRGVPIIPVPQVHVETCQYNTNFSDSTMVFSLIDDGGGYFVWDAESQSNSLLTNRLIDSEEHLNFTLKLQVQYKTPQDNIGDSVVFSVSQTTIVVTVLDEDDNLPLFNESHYTFNVTDNDTAIVNKPSDATPPIFGYDPDRTNNNITYSIKEQEEDGLFTIADDGKIVVTRAIPRETSAGKIKDTYRVTLQVCQRPTATFPDDSKRCGQATLTIHIIDVNNNLPTFPTSDVNATLNEHALVGTAVCSVSAVDIDEGENAIFSYKLLNYDEVFSINENGQISVKSSILLDREGDNFGIFVFKVGTLPSSGGQGKNNVTVTVTLVDVNDNSPKFEHNTYAFNISSMTTGHLVGNLSVTDLDEGANANITFEVLVLDACNNDPLPVNITVDGSMTLNMATPPCILYRFLAKACDNPVSGGKRCDVATVTIYNPHDVSVPINISMTYTIPEQMPAGTIIGPVNCSGVPETVYSLDSPYFTLQNDSTGLLRTRVVMDREINHTYNFNLHVRNNKEICFLNITVHVSDINDNAPIFANSSYVFNLKDVNVNDVIGHIMANDLDEEDNAELEYGFLNRNEKRFFINATSGAISVLSLDDLNDDVIELVVAARDKGVPPLQSVTSVFITKYSDGASVQISTPMEKSDVEKQKNNLEKLVSDLVKFAVRITDVVTVESRSRRSTNDPQSASTIRSRIQLTASAGVKHETLLSSVVTHYEGIRSLFTAPSVPIDQSVPTKDRLGAAEIALIAMGAVILVGAIVTIVVINRQFNSHKRYKQLYENMTRHSSIYESQEIKMTMDDETSDYNGSVKTQDLDEADPLKTQGIIANSTNPVYQTATSVVHGQTNGLVSATNPVYMSSGNHTPVIVDTVVEGDLDPPTEVKEIIERLEQLSDRLEQEENSNRSLGSQDDLTTDLQDAEQAILPPEDYMTVEDRLFDHSYENIIIASRRDDNESDNEGVIKMKDEYPADDFERGDGDEDEGEEPNPDYNIKAVRFSTQVLDADENKLEPLKAGKDQVGDADESNMDKQEDDDTDVFCDANSEAAVDPEADVERGWSEEQINSPVSEVSPDEQEFYFQGGDQDTMTYL